jgi:8-amino-7-oxononanoate synthase
VIVGDTQATIQASRLLEDEGFLVIPIRPPTVPDGTARLRLSFSALHPDDEIERLADIIRTRIL